MKKIMTVFILMLSFSAHAHELDALSWLTGHWEGDERELVVSGTKWGLIAGAMKRWDGGIKHPYSEGFEIRAEHGAFCWIRNLDRYCANDMTDTSITFAVNRTWLKEMKFELRPDGTLLYKEILAASEQAFSLKRK